MKTCSLCERVARVGNRRSHSNIATKRLQKINLQKITYQGKRTVACTKCIKTMGKVKKIK